MSNVYSINDLSKYAESIRKNAALSLTDKSGDNLDEYISITQVENIISSNSIGVDDEDNLLIDEHSFDTTFDEVRVWMYNVALAKLASENKIECAWDDKTNEMIFWVPSSELTLERDDNESRKQHKKRNRTSKDKS